jgi:hypothetical protein
VAESDHAGAEHEASVVAPPDEPVAPQRDRQTVGCGARQSRRGGELGQRGRARFEGIQDRRDLVDDAGPIDDAGAVAVGSVGAIGSV